VLGTMNSCIHAHFLKLSQSTESAKRNGCSCTVCADQEKQLSMRFSEEVIVARIRSYFFCRLAQLIHDCFCQPPSSKPIGHQM